MPLFDMSTMHTNFCDAYNIFYNGTLPWVECDLDTEYRIEYDRLFIRGSDSLENYLINFDVFGKTSYHDGFYRMALAIEYSPGFRQTVEYFKIRQIIGHSAGGAVAAILGQRLGILSMAINTPRFCKHNLEVRARQYFESSCFIVNQRYDPVSYLPPCFTYPTKVNYRHYFNWNLFKVHSRIDITI